VLVSGVASIRAKKARYFEDPRLTERILAPSAASDHVRAPSPDDWSRLPAPAVSTGPVVSSSSESGFEDTANGGIRREPELPQHEEIVAAQAKPAPEFVCGEEDPDDDAVRARALRQQARFLARQAAMDPGDDIDL
jgi:type IV secretion system protein VirD4